MKKTVLITGATSGIGEACARKFAQGSYRLIITGRNRKKLETLKVELESAGAEVRALVFDVRDAAAAKAAFDSLGAAGTTAASCCGTIGSAASGSNDANCCAAGTTAASCCGTIGSAASGSNAANCCAAGTTADSCCENDGVEWGVKNKNVVDAQYGADIQNGAGGDIQNGAGGDIQNGAGGDIRNEAGCDIRNGAGGDIQNGAGSDWQRIDVLINNAGLALGLEREFEGDPEDWDTMIDTNIKGLLTMTRLVVPGMVERNCGHVINVGSVAGDAAYAGGNVYCATKAAVKVITDGLRIDVADTAVRVTNIKPGLVETNFSRVRFKGDDARAGKVYEGIKPLTGEDIADVAFYAASAPEHVQIAEVLVLATHQASGSVVVRR